MSDIERDKFLSSLRHCMATYGINESRFIGVASQSPTKEKYLTFEAESFEGLYDLVADYVSKSKCGDTLYWRSFPVHDRPRVRLLVTSADVDVDFTKGIS